ncbi:hypothetical protein LguiB_026642 [Lonicera macranthoides]
MLSAMTTHPFVLDLSICASFIFLRIIDSNLGFATASSLIIGTQIHNPNPPPPPPPQSSFYVHSTRRRNYQYGSPPHPPRNISLPRPTQPLPPIRQAPPPNGRPRHLHHHPLHPPPHLHHCRRPGLTFTAFSDGYEDGFKIGVDNPDHLISELQTRGSPTVEKIITSSAEQGRPVSCVVYTLFLTWAATVAHEFHVPSAMLWVQPASVLDIYYHYFNGYDEIICTNGNDPNWSIALPGLPLLKARDLPAHVLPSDPHTYALKFLKEQFEILEEEEKPKVLVNTFDALEPDALRVLAKFKMTGIGPLILSTFLDGQDPSDNSFGGDLYQKSSDYIEFLNSKCESSVVYISFGSVLVLKDAQLEEIARALLGTRRPFLWVIRGADEKEESEKKDKVSFMEELKKQGTIVQWCSQLESLTCGVAAVAFPQWMDQGTNAKLIEDMWGSGVRVTANEDGTVESGEISRCVEMVMGDGEKGDELRRNATKWKVLAREASKEGGSSYKNLKEFVQEL